MKTIPFLLILTAGLLAAVTLETASTWTNTEPDRAIYRRLIETENPSRAVEWPEKAQGSSTLQLPRYPGQWSMAWSNHGDSGYHGPVAVIERAPDGNTIKEYPVLWRTVDITNIHELKTNDVWIADPNGTLQKPEFATNLAVTKATGITNIEAPPAKTLWLSSTIVTNWHEWDNGPKRIDPQFYIGDYPPPQATYGYSIGEVRSNAVLNVLFGGKTNQIEQSSTILGFIRKDWKLKPAERETTEQPFTPAKPFQKVVRFVDRPEISYVVEFTNLTVWANTNAYLTNFQSVVTNKVWK